MVMGVLVIPAYGRRSPAKAALLLLAMTGLFVLVVDLAELRDERQRMVLLFAAFALAWLRFAGYLQLSLFQRTFQLDTGRAGRAGYVHSGIVGAAWGFGWTPCIGPVLTGILTLAAQSADAVQGTYLLVAYSAGLGIPFLVAGLMLGDATAFFRRISRYTPIIEVASGLMLIAVGALLLSGRLTALNRYFEFTGVDEGL
jgi:cytochrome c biogenesis protein CcdA